MRAAVFGLGYVGSVMTAALADAGHSVVGVDVQPDRVALLAGGGSPVIEPGVPEAIAAGAGAGRITATADVADAIAGADLSFICVGTPPTPDGSLDVSRVEAVCATIGAALADRTGPAHAVVIRSTVMPGTTERCLGILAEASGRAPGDAFTLAVNPEFLREGVGMSDFVSAPFTLIGCREEAWAAPLAELYGFIEAPVAVTSPGVAELLKTVCNAWHATKVSFANEVGRLCGELAVDPHELMRLFVRDKRLNLSASYLTPGFAYGGSCLPKDVEALGHLARHLHVELPIIQAVPRSNERHIDRAFAAIEASGCDSIGFLGLSFKAGTDDLRGSPLLTLVQRCLGRGLRVRVYDPNVQVASLVGSNRDYALSLIRRLDDLLVTDPADLGADLYVLGHGTVEMAAAARALPADVTVLDLVRAVEPEELQARYLGLAW